MNLVDVLLNTDKNLLEMRTEKHEVKRLSKLLGQKFELTLQQIPTKRYTEIQSICLDLDVNTKRTKVNSYKLQMLTICDGIREPNFNNKDLLKKYNAGTPIDLFSKLFNAGECTTISDKITRLCGYGDEDKKVDEIKN